jgi:type IV pilus assembly protein PilB
VVRLVDRILRSAIDEGASDIHVEETGADVRIRLRIDGLLRQTLDLPAASRRAVLSRLKVLAGMDISVKRRAQDGRIPIDHGGRSLTLRVSTLPVNGGEKAVVRILDSDTAPRSLQKLGMAQDDLSTLRRLVARGEGVVLSAGPTGSGKSTTLFAALSELDRDTRNVVTLEDPVEYRLPGASQIQVDRRAGLGFAEALRAVLRQDPDVVMVGEIRDSETARIAIEAALTGHMMLTTLHTNDAPGAITRLTKMGIEAFLTASAVDCVVAQRLARKLCPHCKRRVVISQQALAEAEVRVGGELEAYEAVGCSRCNGSGYRGRVGVFSVMGMSERIKEMTVDQAPEAGIASTAREEGMLTLREDGLDKVRAGHTSLEEVVRVTA